MERKKYCKIRETFKILDLIPIVKYDGGKSLFWESMAAFRVGKFKFKFIHESTHVRRNFKA